MATITRRFFETTSAANMASIDSLEAAYSAKFKTEAEASKIQNAVEYGRRVATAIFSWSATDGGHQAYSRICYQAQQNLTESFLYARRLFEMAQQTGARPYLRDAYELYWKMYDGQGRTDSAYKYNLKYTAIKDSILSDEYRRNIALS